MKDRYVGKAPVPTGTSMMMATKIAAALGKTLDDVTTFGRPRGLDRKQSERPRGQICIHSVRAGTDDFHEMQVIFAGRSQRLVLSSRTEGSGAFSEGTVKAIRYLQANRDLGKILDMFDVLRLSLRQY